VFSLFASPTQRHERQEPCSRRHQRIAVVLFVIAGKIVWAATLVMLVAAVLGGYFGARIARA